jgi:hypothetical protein
MLVNIEADSTFTQAKGNHACLIPALQQKPSQIVQKNICGEIDGFRGQ